MVEYPIITAKYTVYVHVNNVNQKKYVGITKQDVNKRWRKGLGYKYNSHFYGAIQKYGWDGFNHFIIHSNVSNYDASVLEQIYIMVLHTRDHNFGYNIQEGGRSVDQIIKPINYIDLTGKKYNRLTIMYRNGFYVTPSGTRKTIWHCRCECGNEIDASYQDIVNEHTKSCGCLNYQNRTTIHPNQYQIIDDKAYIYLDSDQYFIIDVSNYDLIKNYKWRVGRNNNIVSDKNSQHPHILLKQLLLKYKNRRTHIDFINGNCFDYTINNIRITPNCDVDQIDYQFYVYTDLPFGCCSVSDHSWIIRDLKTKRTKRFVRFDEYLSYIDNQYGTNHLIEYEKYRQKVI